MAFQYDYCVYIGRFQPFHLGHLETVKLALQISERLIVILGSARVAPNIKNPWTAAEREAVIRACLLFDWHDRVCFAPVRDRLYDEGAWISDVRQQVAERVGDESRIAIVGYHKDASSYYLNLFPEWTYVPTPYYRNINSTDIRTLYFALSPNETVRSRSQIVDCIPTPTQTYLEEFREQPRYDCLRDEFAYIQSYKHSWATAPYPPILVVVNAIVLHDHHLLTICRREHPGRGTLALPGGFLEPEETILAATLRELSEETNIDISAAQLQQSRVAQHVFDRPQRSLRGRAIAHVSAFELATEVQPRVREGDDATEASWLSLDDLATHEDRFFSDHYQIIRYVLTRLKSAQREA